MVKGAKFILNILQTVLLMSIMAVKSQNVQILLASILWSFILADLIMIYNNNGNMAQQHQNMAQIYNNAYNNAIQNNNNAIQNDDVQHCAAA